MGALTAGCHFTAVTPTVDEGAWPFGPTAPPKIPVTQYPFSEVVRRCVSSPRPAPVRDPLPARSTARSLNRHTGGPPFLQAMSPTPTLSVRSINQPAQPVKLTPAPRLDPASPTIGPPPQVLQMLREVPLFQTLPEPLLGLLTVRAQLRRHARDDLIVRQGGVDGLLFILRQGRAHVERAAESRRTVLLDVLEPGALIGEMSLIDGAPHGASVRCVQPCEVLVLRGAEVMHCQAQSPDFSQAWACALVQRLRESNQRIMSMSLDGVRERVLWQLNQWSEPVAPAGRVVSSRIGRSELARMVGASREMVCRVLRALQTAGRIELRRDRSILLRDPSDH